MRSTRCSSAPLVPELLGARSEAFTSFRMRAAGDEAPREAVGLVLCLGWALAVGRVVAARRIAIARAQSGVISISWIVVPLICSAEFR